MSKGVHFIAPTLPGYGNTSPPAHNTTYAATIAHDTSALLDHLHPDTPDLSLYIGGGSFGTIAAQMLYGAPFDTFPAGRHIKGLLLISAFPPFQNDKEKGFEYTRSMPWFSYIGIGPPTRFVPFRLLQRSARLIIQFNICSQEKAEAFFHKFLSDKMGEEEKAAFKAWKEKRGYEEGEFEREMAQIMRRSVEKSWEGFLSTQDVLHGDWGWGGKKLGELDREHTEGRKVMVVTSDGDEGTPAEWGEYLSTKYANARLKNLHGGHIASLFHFDEIWTDFLEA
jgi:pimeloyl-ACP methyl ester carboxylesterase